MSDVCLQETAVYEVVYLVPSHTADQAVFYDPALVNTVGCATYNEYYLTMANIWHVTLSISTKCGEIVGVLCYCIYDVLILTFHLLKLIQTKYTYTYYGG